MTDGGEEHKTHGAVRAHVLNGIDQRVKLIPKLRQFLRTIKRTSHPVTENDHRRLHRSHLGFEQLEGFARLVEIKTRAGNAGRSVRAPAEVSKDDLTHREFN